MRHSHRASYLIAIVTALVSCSSPEGTPAARNGPDYVAQLTADYARWQKAVAGGTEPAVRMWECALCPKISVQPAGTVWTGTPTWESGREQNEPALAQVSIPAPFGIGLYEVTRGQFAAFARATGRKLPASCLTDRRKRGVWAVDAGASYLDVGFEQGDDHPAACVSFEDARDYVAWLNTQTSGGYRLPTEAEWEFSARSNAHLLYAWSDEVLEACLYANVLDQAGGAALRRKDGTGCDDGAVATAPVGSHLPLVFETFDMIGNVAEWVDGCAGPSSADHACAGRIAKGGSWASSSSHLRPAARSVLSPGHCENTLGFRVAKSLWEADAPLDNAAAYLRRGRVISTLRDARRALSDLEHAVQLERSATTLAARGWELYWENQTKAARADFDAALLLDPNNAVAIAGLGSVLLADPRDPKTAIEKYDRALALAPDFVLALGQRAWAHNGLGQSGKALADIEAVLRLAPTYMEMFELRIGIQQRRADWAQTLEATDRMMEAFSTLPRAQSLAAWEYSVLLQDEDAMRAANRAVRLNNQNIDSYLRRAEVRLFSDTKGRREDIEAALKIDPKAVYALMLRAEMESQAGNHGQAAQSLAAALAEDNSPGMRARLLNLRGIEYLHDGQQKLAAQDFSSSLGDSPEARELNNLCWELALADVGIERALSYCNRAITLKPDSAAYLDSKGLVLLRMNRLEESIRAYDAALRIEPGLSSSLYGRAMATQQRCDCAAGGADIKKAMQSDPSLGRRFERAGLALSHPPKIKPIERTLESSAS